MRWLLAWLLVSLTAAFVAPAMAAPDNPVASAAQVVVRGRRTLEDALQVPLGAVLQTERATRPAYSVLFVVDVTPYTAAAEDAIAQALVALDDEAPVGGTWRIARLGERPLPPVDRPGRLAQLLGALLAEDTEVGATIPALERTIRALPDRDTTIVYLADWRFEDDVGLEPFLRQLRKRRHVFHVIGAEACFQRAWNDGFFPPDRGTQLDNRGGYKLYADGIGRSPFGPEDETAPWHGGDVAWPHIPIRFTRPDWTTEFPVKLAPPPARKSARSRYAEEPEADERRGKPGDPEDLQDRQEEKHAEDVLDRYWFPLSSGFGSYPLMRAAAVTGGRYVLFSWNPSGRSDLTYDYSRCNLFAPDLRPRATIHADVPKRPVALALLRAWHELANRKIGVVSTTAPLATNGRTPLEMQEPEAEWFLDTSWDEPREHKLFLALAPRYLQALRTAIRHLDTGLANPVADAVDRRYHADATLLRHVLLVLHFQLGEALVAAQGLDVRTAWDELPLHPTLDPVIYLRQERDPGLVIPEDVEIADPEAGERVTAERRKMLEKYAGTPYGEMVARNRVSTYRVVWVGYASGQPTKRSPSESDGTGTPTPPGRGSGGGGPTTGP